MSDLYVARLVQYGIESGLIPEEERIYSTNQILEVMKKDDYEAPTAEEVGTEINLADTLGHLLDEALESGVLEDGGIVSRDLFDTKLMNCLTPRPAQVIAKFREDYAENRRKRPIIIITSVWLPTISVRIVLQKTVAGKCRQSMARSISPSI